MSFSSSCHCEKFQSMMGPLRAILCLFTIVLIENSVSHGARILNVALLDLVVPRLYEKRAALIDIVVMHGKCDDLR